MGFFFSFLKNIIGTTRQWITYMHIYIDAFSFPLVMMVSRSDGGLNLPSAALY